MSARSFIAICVTAGIGSGCGLYTPAKDPFRDDTPTATERVTQQASYELGIVNHVQCEIANGLRAAGYFRLFWLNGWGTTVTQSITAEDQSGLAPGLTFMNPMRNAVFTFPSGGNVVTAQSFSFSVGGTASANALRTETIQYTMLNKDLLLAVDPSCSEHQPAGVMIDGDLKIEQFIYDKAAMAASNNLSVTGSASSRPTYNTWTEEITFVAAYGGSATPTWKLAQISADTSSNLVVAERTNTNDLIITLGPLAPGQPKKNQPLELSQNAMNQHNARVAAAAIAVSISGQSH